MLPFVAHAQGALLETLDDLRNVPDAPASRGIIPTASDISGSMPPPRAQGETDTCTSWAVTYAAASAALRPSHPEQPELTLSPAFSYPLAGGGRFCRGKTLISKTLDVARDYGALPLQQYAFDPGWCAREPTPQQKSLAADFRIWSWAKLDAQDIGSVKYHISEHRPVIFGMPVGRAFWGFHGSGVFDTVESGAGTTGHAMVLVGYDDQRNAFRLINSLGKAWGDGGFAWISYGVWQKQVSVGFVVLMQPAAHQN